MVEIVNVDLPLAGKMDESENNAVTNVSNEAFISPTLQLLSRIRYRRIPLGNSLSMQKRFQSVSNAPNLNYPIPRIWVNVNGDPRLASRPQDATPRC